MGGSEIREKIIRTLEDNGDLGTSEFRRLVLFALVDLSQGAENARICRREIEGVNKRVDKLENYNILLIASKHPKATVVIGAIIGLFTITIIAQLELWGWILEVINEYTGVPLP